MWYDGLIGGLVIGVSTAMFLFTTGRVTGLSGVVHGLVLPDQYNSAHAWKFSYLAGMLLMAAVLALATPSLFLPSTSNVQDINVVAYALGGFLVGFGTRLGNGCTSGHGICGLSRLSPRSGIAVMTFFTAGLLSATLFNGRDWLMRPPELVNISNEPIPVISYVVGVVAIVLLALAVLLRKQAKDGVWDALLSFATGAIFMAGLAVGGMTDRSIIVSFLDVTSSSWNPQLAFVMGGAILIAGPAFQYAMWSKRSAAAGSTDDATPTCLGFQASSTTPTGMQWSLPSSTVITARLAVGSWLFGAGWGLTGLCPGPALAQTAAGMPSVLIFFLPAMFLGMVALSALERRWAAQESKVTAHELSTANKGALQVASALFAEAAEQALQSYGSRNHVRTQPPHSPERMLARGSSMEPPSPADRRASMANGITATDLVATMEQHAHVEVAPEDVGRTMLSLLDTILLHHHQRQAQRAAVAAASSTDAEGTPSGHAHSAPLRDEGGIRLADGEVADDLEGNVVRQIWEGPTRAEMDF